MFINECANYPKARKHMKYVSMCFISALFSEHHERAVVVLTGSRKN